MKRQLIIIANDVAQRVLQQTKGAPLPSMVTAAGVRHHTQCICSRCKGAPSSPDLFELTSEPSAEKLSPPDCMPLPGRIRLPMLVVSGHDGASRVSSSKRTRCDVDALRLSLVRRLDEWMGGLVLYDNTASPAASVDDCVEQALSDALRRADERFPGFGAWRLGGDGRLLAEHIAGLAIGLRFRGVEPEFSVLGGWRPSKKASGNPDLVAHQLRSFGLSAGLDARNHLPDDPGTESCNDPARRRGAASA